MNFGHKPHHQTNPLYTGLRLGLLVYMVSLIVLAAVCQAAPQISSDTEEQHRRARQEAQERQQRQQQKDVFLQNGEKASQDTSLSDETPSFSIKSIVLEGGDTGLFAWTGSLLEPYANRKIGMQGINLIVKRLTNALIDHGYVTTRVLIPEQNLSSGTLKLVLIPGRIASIRLEPSNVRANWRTAFPARPGDILNLRQLEQGLEQMKRVPSQDVDMKLVPGQNSGESDIVLNVKQGKREKFILSVDDSGTTATGKIQTAETFSFDNLLGINDLCNIGMNGDGERRGSLKGTNGGSFYYSFPAGDTTFSFSASNYKYHQTIATNTQPFLYSGESDSREFHITQLLRRDQTSKTSFECSIITGSIRNYIEDAEIVAQHKDTTALKIGLSHRQYFGDTTLNFEIDNKRGVPWFGAQPDDQTPGQPTTRYNMWLVDASLSSPVILGKTKGSYSLAFHGQYTNDVLYATDFLSIGNRWTVRGFDGEQSLSAERGWYLRNELTLQIGSGGQEAYVGLDCGEVSGPDADNLTGRILAGMAVGLRGGGNGLSYDVFVGWPLRKPDGFQTANTTFGFQLTYQI